MAGIATCLWFDGRAEEAMEFYIAAFRKAGREASRGETLHQQGGVLVASAVLDGHAMIGLNGGPQFTFTPAISLTITCAEQGEVDRFWKALSDGGEPGRCGWLTDRYGVSWQVVPKVLPEMLRDPYPARAGRVMQAMMGMGKLDIAELEAAHG